MENLVIKRKQFQVVEQLGEHSYLATYKNKKYFVKKFNDKDTFVRFMIQSKKINGSGVTSPKIKLYDKKDLYFVAEYLDGKTVMDMLVEGNLKEDIYNQLFQQFWYAKADRVGLDYRTDNWKYINGKLYYLPFVYGEYAGKDIFLKEQIHQWFYSNEFANYMKEKGLEPDPSRLPNEYELNRSVTLMSVKYYRG